MEGSKSRGRRRRLAAAAALAACLGASACSTKAPVYQASVENVQTLSGLGPVKAAVGTVKLDERVDGSMSRISVRGLSIESPYPGGYAEHLAEALRADLAAAGKLDPKAPRTINAVMTANRLDASGVNVGVAEIAARFTVTDGRRVLYDKRHDVKHEWESSFMGALAAMNAIQHYNVTLQKLVGRLFSDAAFKQALE
jgi:hypothetical protein